MCMIRARCCRQLPAYHQHRRAACCAGLAGAGNAGPSLKAGDAAIERGEFGAAVSLFSRAVEEEPRGILPLTKRAAAHGKLGEHAAALQDLTRALQLDNSSTQVLLHRCQLASIGGTLYQLDIGARTGEMGPDSWRRATDSMICETCTPATCCSPLRDAAGACIASP